MSTDDVDEARRCFLKTSACALGGAGALCALMPLAASWMPSARTRAHALPVQVDLTHLSPGQCMTVVWRGEPVWILHRTPYMLNHLQDHDAQLRDPDSRVDQQPDYAMNAYRSIKPEYLVLIGLCTHLGCVPAYKSDGFYCPCHGSQFDLAGRVFKDMPAPINLKVPPYRYLSDTSLLIGESAS